MKFIFLILFLIYNQIILAIDYSTLPEGLWVEDSSSFVGTSPIIEDDYFYYNNKYLYVLDFCEEFKKTNTQLIPSGYNLDKTFMLQKTNNKYNYKQNDLSCFYENNGTIINLDAINNQDLQNVFLNKNTFENTNSESLDILVFYDNKILSESIFNSISQEEIKNKIDLENIKIVDLISIEVPESYDTVYTESNKKDYIINLADAVIGRNDMFTDLDTVLNVTNADMIIIISSLKGRRETGQSTLGTALETKTLLNNGNINQVNDLGFVIYFENYTKIEKKKVFSHEFGHVLGLGHDLITQKKQDSIDSNTELTTSGAYHYSKANFWDDNFNKDSLHYGTIMSYADNIIPIFSNVEKSICFSKDGITKLENSSI